MNPISITRRLNSVKDDFFKTLLSRKDFEIKIEQLNNSTPSEYHTLCASLCEMLDAVSIKYDKDKVTYLGEMILDGKISEFEDRKKQSVIYFKRLIQKATLMDFGDIESKILSILFDKFSDFPTPSEYMERIVNRLSNPKDNWENDSLRLRILKQFIKYGNCLVYEKENGKYVSIYGWEKIILAYAKAHGDAEVTSISDAVKFIDEGIFDEYFTSISTFQNLLNELQKSDSIIKARESVKLIKQYKKKITKLSADEVYCEIIKELEHRLAELNKLKQEQQEIPLESIHDKECELKKYKKEIESSPKKSDIYDKIVKEIEQRLKNAEIELKEENKKLDKAKSKLKYEKERYGLVRLADDLANAKFRAGGATKRDLYLFAIVFNMTYYCPNRKVNSDMILDYESDIEKNLFIDFYTNNLMRFITDAYSGKLSALDLDPSSEGINYKNFAEIVFIYYISKDCEPIKKIQSIYDMLARLKNTAERKIKVDSSLTNYYSSLFTEDILELSESEFEEFVRANYDCNLNDENGKNLNKTVFQIQTNHEGAFKIYCKLIEDMRNMRVPMLRENCNYGLWLTDISMLSKCQNSKIKKVLMGDSEKIEQFITLLRGINSFLGLEFFEEENEKETNVEDDKPSQRVIRAMDIQSSENITRTALIVAYYYYYNAHNDNIRVSKNLLEVYKDYTNEITGLNALLIKSHFQPISERNIFDIAVIFSSYAYLVN